MIKVNTSLKEIEKLKITVEMDGIDAQYLLDLESQLCTTNAVTLNHYQTFFALCDKIKDKFLPLLEK